MDHHFLQLLACFSSLLSSCLKVSLLCFAIHHFCKALLASFCFSIGKDVLSPSSHYPLALFDGGEQRITCVQIWLLFCVLWVLIWKRKNLLSIQSIWRLCSVYIVFYSGDMCYIWNMNGNFHGDVCPSCNVAPEHLASRQAFDSSRPRPFGENILRFSLVICFLLLAMFPIVCTIFFAMALNFFIVHLIFPKPQYPKPLSIHFANLGLLLCILLVFLAFVFQRQKVSITTPSQALQVQSSTSYSFGNYSIWQISNACFPPNLLRKKVFFAYSHLCRCLQLIHFWKPQESLIEELKKECELERKAWPSAFGNDRFTPHLHQTVFEDPKAMEKYGNSFLSLSIQLNERTKI